tara:strand:+ start:2773 stop:3168 length:396 start_codon:yes stop_codon:yes gene_type:complete
MAGIGPKLPLQFDNTDGYRLTKTINEQVRQNLKSLVLTAPGERVMDPNFGVGIRNYLFLQVSEGVVGKIRSEIKRQVKRYMPFLQIIDVEINSPDGTQFTDDNMLGVNIKYKFLPTDDLDTLTINLAQTNY